MSYQHLHSPWHGVVHVLCFLQLDESCSLSEGAAAGAYHEHVNAPVTGMLRLVAALALFFEGLAGVYIPVLLKSFEGYEW